jgi:sulfur carrier protein
MQVLVNGQERSLESGTTVAELVASLPLPDAARRGGRGIAVAIDTQVIPRSAWGETELTAGVRVEVLTAVQGG